MSSLTTFKTRGGAPFTVAGQHADKFRALLDELEAAGYAIDPGQSGGYNDRNIAGTNKLSNHAHGAAVDVNWNANARGGQGDIPADLARSLASKHGMTWGGDWKNPDPMHFEIAGNVAPLASGGPTDPGYVPPSYDPAAPSVANGSPPAATGGSLDDMIASLFGSGGEPQQPQAKSGAEQALEALGSLPPAEFAQISGKPKPVDVSHLREAIMRRAQMRGRV